MDRAMDGMTIGKLAESCEVSRDTLRFYERERLLPVPKRSASGYRLYQEAAAAGVSASAERINILVRSGRCACEVRNPQGTCCLGNVFVVAKAAAPPIRALLRDTLVGCLVDD